MDRTLFRLSEYLLLTTCLTLLLFAQALLELVENPDVTEEEVGQRILTALKKV